MSRVARLAELRALRASGKTRLDSYQVQEDHDVYDEVDEEGYKKVVRSRLDQDDFVVDDNGGGYADDGREEWDTRYTYASDSEEELPARGTKAAKRKREEERDKIEQTNHSINNYFKKGAAAQAAKSKPKVMASAEDEAFMAGVLAEVDVNLPSTRPAVSKVVKAESRRKVRVLSPPLESGHSRRKQAEADLPGTPTPAHPSSDDNDSYLPAINDDAEAVSSDPVQAPSSPTTKAVQRKTAAIKIEPNSDNEDDDMLDVAEAKSGNAIQGPRINISGARPIKKEIKQTAYPTPENSSPTKPQSSGAVDAAQWNDVNAKLNVLSSPAQTSTPGKLDVNHAMEADGSIRLFWTDYIEISGSLYLFGKVQDKSSGAYVSACIKLDNIQRKLYFLPRKYKMKRGMPTDEEVEVQDVFEEVDQLLSQRRVLERKCKTVDRKYAFELQDIPREAEYLKVMYPYHNPSLSDVPNGDTFSHVFGINTSLFEQFVLWKNIMGPCWLQIDAESFGQLNNASYCKLELQLADPKRITPLKDNDALDAPPLTVMSMAFRTTHNAKENKQEILMASMRLYENVSLNDTTGADKLPCRVWTIMRPIDKAYPMGFEAACRTQRGTVSTETSEQMLLSKFLAILERADPDVMVGHGLQDVDYPILLSRLRERKTPSWGRIGRLRRSEWPKLGKHGAGFWAEREIRAGRLMCDVANDLGKSLMSKCQSWSLTEMCDLYLPAGNMRQELDNDVALKTWATSRDGLLSYAAHCEADTYFTAAVALGVQMLPLSKVLTNLAGNSWARTLSGTRAERNEYILLHEFYRNKYICPDKIWGRQRPKASEDDGDHENGDANESGKRGKAKYEGGLVFEPERGLYDKCILVMDFNSLYPSIIQEYNICFTTVDRAESYKDEEKVPEVPEEQKQGILPKLIATLVDRRRQVKKLMKDKRATPEQRATWDIKQLALKLTANSMYGCLGYTQSRFYARPLAMLTTFKGREILRSTKELVESQGALRVVYGDTDSVMINTNVDSVEEAVKVGKELRDAINDRYRLLEIDIDNIFRRLLLHAKKKYAAINLTEGEGGKWIEKLEVKGLDMKRREYCALSKDASQAILNEALSGDDTEITVSKIQDYLRDLAEKMRSGQIRDQKFIIYTKLGKDPRSYPNADSMPQVQVALRALAAGKPVRMGDVISYITTMTTDTSLEGSGGESIAAKRAYSPMDVQKSNGTLKPDIDWYLAKQLFPPIERLCAPIDGMTPGLLAECFGLDPKRYASMGGQHGSGSGDSSNAFDFVPLESLLPDEVRYRDCPRLELKCVGCGHVFEWRGLRDAIRAGCADNRGVICPKGAAALPETAVVKNEAGEGGDNADTEMTTSATTTTADAASTVAGGCGKVMRPLTVVAQVEHAVRQLSSAYYDAWLSCDDSTCPVRTRSMSVYGTRCMGPHGLAKGCRGKVKLEQSGAVVAKTLGYWRTCFDVERALQSEARSSSSNNNKEDKALSAQEQKQQQELLKAVATNNRMRFDTVRRLLEQYERRSGWVWVQMDTLFAFALKGK